MKVVSTLILAAALSFATVHALATPEKEELYDETLVDDLFADDCDDGSF